MLCIVTRIYLALEKKKTEFFIVKWYVSGTLNSDNTACMRSASKDIVFVRLLKHLGIKGVIYHQQIWMILSTFAKLKAVSIRSEPCRSVSSPFSTAFSNNSFSFSLFGFLVFHLSLDLFYLHYFNLFSKLFLDSYFNSCHSSFCCLCIFILNFWYFSGMIFNFVFFLCDLTYWFATSSHTLPFFSSKTNELSGHSKSWLWGEDWIVLRIFLKK